MFYAFEYDNLLAWRKPTIFYSREEVNEAVEHPKIIHFTRNFYMKSHPWKEGAEHPMNEIYRSYMCKTPWKELWIDNRTLKQERRYKLWHMIPQKVLCQGANVLYNYVRPLMWWKNE